VYEDLSFSCTAWRRYVGEVVFMSGTKLQREKAKEYLKWLLELLDVADGPSVERGISRVVGAMRLLVQHVVRFCLQHRHCAVSLVVGTYVIGMLGCRGRVRAVVLQAKPRLGPVAGLNPEGRVLSFINDSKYGQGADTETP
jgi:hypothetical protein